MNDSRRRDHPVVEAIAPAKPGYVKFKNDRGVPEVRIGVKQFMCAGASAPHDHPHVYLDMGDADAILCPYCATRFRHDPRLEPHESDPPGSVFFDDAQRGAGRDLLLDRKSRESAQLLDREV